MLKPTQIRKLSKGGEGVYDFDFSLIPSEYYEILFRSLQTFCIKNVDSIGFNCNELAKYNNKPNVRLPHNVINSVAKKRKHYIRNMIELLCYFIPRSQRIKEVTFSHLSIRNELIERLITVINKSNNIKSIKFTYVAIGDTGVGSVLRILNPNKIERISFLKCGLTGAITQTVLQFINRKTSPEIGLQSFEVSPTEIPDADRRLIQQALNGNSRVQSIDLSIDTKEDVVDSLRKQRIAELRSKNEELKNNIKALNEMLNAIKFNDSMFVVGEGSADFVMYLNTLEQKLTDIDKNM
ncbi:eukaryotic initiation factor [Histomonas meleagridis]|uniref:eukaryotic initiation factor n=1 Tax=Histomonas meleagridis TaxID=135588 RepID=UPI003559A943|nr:eukaryotic initiation factor [Histomonas meleagridis]KAH0804424.1 eukaryotic initiation factor [Histomonas meleagridis]